MITFKKMFRDGICQVTSDFYTKMVEFYDINYDLLEIEDQGEILEEYSKLINYFDPSVRFELVLFNRQVNEQMLTEQFDIPWQEDDFNDIREEYTEMLKKQAAKGNNGIIKSKYLIFGVESNGYKEAKSRLNNIEKDVIRNLNNIGTLARGLDGKEDCVSCMNILIRIPWSLSAFRLRIWQNPVSRSRTILHRRGLISAIRTASSREICMAVCPIWIYRTEVYGRADQAALDIDANLTISMHIADGRSGKGNQEVKKTVISNIQR